jgi:ribosomal protein S18 acetylase RimI-like enzyme
MPPHLLTNLHLPAAVETLTRAFHADPIFTHFFPGAATRAERLRPVFELQLRQGLQFGEIHTTSPDCEGVAVWLPVDKIDLDLASYLKLGGLGLLRRTGLGNLLRMLAANDRLTALHRRHFPADGLYLALLGVHPAHQGRGFAKNLLESMLARLDSQKRVACLETENAHNVPLYQHFGFRLVEQVAIPVECWVMVRTVDSGQ